VWGAGVTLLGYFAGASFSKLEHTLGRASASLTVLLIVGALFVWWRRRRHRNNNDSNDINDSNDGSEPEQGSG